MMATPSSYSPVMRDEYVRDLVARVKALESFLVGDLVTSPIRRSAYSAAIEQARVAEDAAVKALGTSGG